MPLLLSPIDGSPMREIERNGVKIDVCPTSGGVWLDKGELEKLLHLMQQEAANDPTYSQQNGSDVYQKRAYYRDDDDDDDYGRTSRYGHGYRGKKSKMSKIMDIFDF